jgi:hypothetical protein
MPGLGGARLRRFGAVVVNRTAFEQGTVPCHACSGALSSAPLSLGERDRTHMLEWAAGRAERCERLRTLKIAKLIGAALVTISALGFMFVQL